MDKVNRRVFIKRTLFGTVLFGLLIPLFFSFKEVTTLVSSIRSYMGRPEYVPKLPLRQSFLCVLSGLVVILKFRFIFSKDFSKFDELVKSTEKNDYRIKRVTAVDNYLC